MYNKCEGTKNFNFFFLGGWEGVVQGRFISIIVMFAFKLDNAIRRVIQYRYKDLE